MTLLRRLIARIRSHWPRVEILLRGDSHYCTPKCSLLSRQPRDYALGVATTTTLRRHIDTLEQSTAARFAAAGGPDKLRRFKEFYDGAASWDRVERIIARIEAGPDGVDTRFIATNLDAGTPRTIYEKVYCQRGQAENHIKSFKTHLAADRTSCHDVERQPVATVPARRRLLDDVAPARADAATLVVARHAVRYPAPATGQARRRASSR